jgi:hypothetical protein
VNRNGVRDQIVALDHARALAYATAAAQAFGIGADRSVDFEATRAKVDLADAAAKKNKGGKAGRKKGSDRGATPTSDADTSDAETDESSN